MWTTRMKRTLSAPRHTYAPSRTIASSPSCRRWTSKPSPLYILYQHASCDMQHGACTCVIEAMGAHGVCACVYVCVYVCAVRVRSSDTLSAVSAKKKNHK